MQERYGIFSYTLVKWLHIIYLLPRNYLLIFRDVYISRAWPVSLQSLHAVDVLTYVQFLPTLLNQLFSLLVKTVSDDVALNVVKWALP